MKDPNESLIDELLVHAAMVVQKAFDHAPMDVALPVSKRLRNGAAAELRVRVQPGCVPRISVVVIDDEGEIEVAQAGGERSAP